jgi:hypothetical protein
MEKHCSASSLAGVVRYATAGFTAGLCSLVPSAMPIVGRGFFKFPTID